MSKVVDNPEAKTEFGEGADEKGENGGNKEKDKDGYGDPIDAISGAVFYSSVDFYYPGPMPLRWERNWSSGNTDNVGLFGYGSSSTYSAYILVESNQVIYINGDGLSTSFDTLAPGEKAFKRSEKLTLSYDGDRYEIFNIVTRQRYVFEPATDPDAFRLKQIENESGKCRIVLEYDTRSYICGLTDSAGRKFQIRSNKTGQIIDVQHDGKTLVKYEYDDNLNLIKLRNINGDISSLFYDEHLLTKRISLGGSVFQWEYAGEGSGAKCVHTWGEDGLLEYWLDYNDGNTVITNSLGSEKQIFYDDNKCITKRIDENGQISVYEYNKYNNMVSLTNADGETTKFTYNEFGQITSLTQPDGGISSLEYDKSGRIVKSVTPLAAETIYEYNAEGKVCCIIAPNGTSSKYQYNDKDMLSVIVEGKGENELKTELEYDKYLNLIKLKYPNGAIEKWEYDDAGNCIRTVNPMGYEQTMGYDEGNRLIKFSASDGKVAQIKYNAYDDVIWIKDNDREVSFIYTALGRLESRKEQNRCIKMKYNTEGQLIQVENEISEMYLYEYDAVGNIITEIGYDGVRKTYDYSPGGKLTGVKRGDSAGRTSIKYDNGGNLFKLEYDNGEIEEYAYGKSGELLSAENKNGKMNFEYDVAGNLIKEIFNGFSIESRYSEDFTLSHRTKIYSSLGLNVDLNLNRFGKTEEINVDVGNQAKYHSQLSYDIMGRRLERTINTANGRIIKDCWSYGPQGRPISKTVSVNRRANSLSRYTWSIGNKLESIIDSITNTGLIYSYDKFGNPDSVTPVNHGNNGLAANGEKVIRRLDDSGRICDTLDVRNTGSRIYGKGGQLLNLNGQTYRYNDCGDMIEKQDENGNTWRYGYHPSGLMESVVRPDGKEVTFTYDAIGRRVSKSFNGSTTKFIWDGNRIVHEWIEDSEQTAPDNQQLITWLFEEETFVPIAKLTKGKAFSIVSDHLGTPSLMLGSDGGIVWNKTFDLFGRELWEGGSRTPEKSLTDTQTPKANGDSNTDDPATVCPFRFQGQYHDVETGLYYNRFRYYDPDSGIYTQRDPIGLSGGNPTVYGYVHDPNTWVDPFGLIGPWGQKLVKFGFPLPVGKFIRPHGHHIVFKDKFPEILGETKDILREFGIDPLEGKENLMWASNTGHSEENARKVADSVKSKAECLRGQFSPEDIAKGKAKEEMGKALQAIGESVFGGLGLKGK